MSRSWQAAWNRSNSRTWWYLSSRPSSRMQMVGWPQSSLPTRVVSRRRKTLMMQRNWVSFRRLISLKRYLTAQQARLSQTAPRLRVSRLRTTNLKQKLKKTKLMLRTRSRPYAKIWKTRLLMQRQSKLRRKLSKKRLTMLSNLIKMSSRSVLNL